MFITPQKNINLEIIYNYLNIEVKEDKSTRENNFMI
jgi:hypothetical protein